MGPEARQLNQIKSDWPAALDHAQEKSREYGLPCWNVMAVLKHRKEDTPDGGEKTLRGSSLNRGFVRGESEDIFGPVVLQKNADRSLVYNKGENGPQVYNKGKPLLNFILSYYNIIL